MKNLFVIAVFMLSLVCIFASCDIIPLPQEKEDIITVEDGYLVVNGVKTEYKVDDGKEPEAKEDVITVDEDGYLVVNGVKTEYNVNSGNNVPNESTCTHAERIENEVKPTCDKSGSYDLVTYCIKCGKEFNRVCVITEVLPHTESDWIVDTAAPCTEAGLRYKECTECGMILESEATSATGHNYIDGSCTKCGEAEPTPVNELEYTLSDDGTYYIVSGIGTCTDTEIIIPQTYKKLPVTQIGQAAFSGCSNISSVFLPNSISNIGYNAFYACESLESINIPEGVSNIGWFTFVNCTSLVDILIPKSVKKIEGCAFKNCTALSNVYYCGDNVDWSVISIDSFDNANSSLTSSTVYYYSETEPTTEGNFWHYVDGVPTVWDTYVEPEKPDYSVGLEYTSIDDTTCYVSGIGSCTDLDIIIPSVAPDGRTVIAIDCSNNSLSYYITSIFIPSTITRIEGWSIIGCQELKSIVVDEHNEFFKSIDGDLYSKDGKTLIRYAHRGVTEFTVPYGVTTIGASAFYNMGNNNLKSVTIPDTVTIIERWAFAYCTGLVYIEIPNGVIDFNIDAFAYTRLDYIVLPQSITYVFGEFFVLDKHFGDIYYKGTTEDWASIKIDDKSNNSLVDSTLYYYSEAEPTEEGNYWRYVDGVPTVW